MSVERLEFGSMVRLGVNAREVLRLSPDKDARRKLAKPLAVLNGTDRFGRAPRLAADELAAVVALRSSDAAVWGWRSLAENLNRERERLNRERPDGVPPLPLVSHMAVKRAFERRS